MRRWAKVFGLAGLLLAVLGSYAHASEFPFQDPSLPIEQRVADLVGRLTPEEKVSQMTMTAAAIPALWHPRIHLVERGAARRGALRHMPPSFPRRSAWQLPGILP